MKKAKFLMMISAFLLLVSGCTSKTPEEALTDAYKETNKINSAEVIMNLEASVEIGDVLVSAKGNMSGQLKRNADDLMGHLNMNMNLGTEKLDLEMYVEKVKDDINMYGKDDEGWSKQSVSLKDLNFDTTTMDVDLKFDEVKELSKDKTSTVYEATIKKATFDKMIQDIKDKAKQEDETIDVDDMIIEVNDVAAKFTVQDKLISKMELVVPIYFEIKMEEAPMQYRLTVKMNIELKNHNKVEDIVVPQEVLDEVAVNEIKDQAEIYSYMARMDMAVNNFKGTYTNTELTEVPSFSEEEENTKYEGPKPTKVELTLDEDYNLAGFIEMEGYIATFENDEMISFEKVKKIDA